MKQTIRILFINHSVRDGGPGRSLFYMLRYIDKARFTPFVLVPKEGVFTELLRNEGLGDKIIVEKKFPENILRPRFNSNRLSPRVLKTASVALNVIDLFLLILRSPFLIRKVKVDVIYCNGTLAKIFGALIGVLNRRPVIWHVRNIQQTRALRFTMNALSLLPAVKKIICVSGAAVAQFCFDQKKISLVHNGVDIEEFNPERTPRILRSEYGIPEGVIVVGSIGRIVPRKGYEYMIKAALIVIKSLGGNTNKVRFVIVGDTPYFFVDNHLEFLKDLVSSLGLKSVFIFTGYKRDIKPYLKDFDIFVIPSSYPDPFPRVVIEAMAFALPVVGFRVGGIAEAVEDGVTGLLNESGNPEQLGNSILRLIHDNSLRASMGIASRERVKKYFSVESKTREIEKKILEVGVK
ncbi:MAG: hypothetical protein C4291_02175 [Candidatus Dadabacteria bacterium]